MVYESKKRRVCPLCKSSKTKKNGHARGVQTYLCKECNHHFSNTRRTSKRKVKRLWKEYVFGKQTIAELAYSNHMDRRGVQTLLSRYQAPPKIHTPRSVHVVVDAIWFGERLEGSSWCAVVARDPKKAETLVWRFVDTETTSVYLELREELEALGYTILSVTGDGFGGIKTAFCGIPYQMCLVHMERLVVYGTTRNPQLEAGQVLLALTKSLHNTDSHTFHIRFKAYIEMYQDFLNEKTTNPFTGERYWTHEDLRRAVQRLMRHKRYLFTFEQNKNIPKNTNSLEGHFGHIRKKTDVHNGLSRSQKEKVLHSIFLVASTSPKVDKLDDIL